MRNPNSPNSPNSPVGSSRGRDVASLDFKLETVDINLFPSLSKHSLLAHTVRVTRQGHSPNSAHRQKPVFAHARSLFGTGTVHESNAMPDGMFVLRDVGPYASSTYLEGLCIVREWYMYPPYMYLWEGNVAAVAGTMANGDGYRHYLQAVVQAAQNCLGRGFTSRIG